MKIMKRVILVVVAVMLPVVMLSGCSKPLSKQEYRKQVIKLIDNYMCGIAGSEGLGEIMMEIDEEFDYEGFDKDTLSDAKKDVEREMNKIAAYLDDLEKLNPPKEMEDFHEDLLSFIEKARDVNEKLLAVFDAKTEAKFESAGEKTMKSLDSLFKKLEKLLKEDWLMDGLEDGEFMDYIS